MQLLYFAWVREKIGKDGEVASPPENVRNIADLIDWLSLQSSAHAEALADRSKLRVAVDHQFASFDTLLANAREVAIFPPVTGG